MKEQRKRSSEYRAPIFHTRFAEPLRCCSSRPIRLIISSFLRRFLQSVHVKKATLTARRGTMGPVMSVRLATERKTTYYLTVRGNGGGGGRSRRIGGNGNEHSNYRALFHRAIARNQKAVLAEQWDPRFELSLSRDHPPPLHLLPPLDYASRNDYYCYCSTTITIERR